MLAFTLLLCFYTDNHGLTCYVHVSGNHVTLRHEAMHGDGWRLENGDIHVIWHEGGVPAARGVYRMEGNQLIGWHDGLVNNGHTWRHWMVRRQR